MELIYIDHYDSFSYNLLDWLNSGSENIKIRLLPYDYSRLFEEVSSMNLPIVLSPGPKSPRDVPQTLEIVASFLFKRPILGVCLGHQILGSLAGGEVVQSVYPLHGEVRTIIPNKKGHFLGSRGFHSFQAAAYNSLTVSFKEPMKENWEVTALCENKDIQVIENWSNPKAPALGVQFHPESFLTKPNVLLESWLGIMSSY